MLKTQFIDYQDKTVALQGFLAYEEDGQKKPAILVVHDWSGLNEFSCRKAEELAKLGYVGFAVDMFGKGVRGETKEEKSALIQPFMQDRPKLQQRILAAFETVKQLDMVDKEKIGAIGYCFGGLCVLDLARAGAPAKGVISFHGLLNTPEGESNPPIKAKILVFHGYDDPMVTPEHVMMFAEEMTHARVDWQMTIYGNTMHAFTNPNANDPGFGTVYNESADKRSWISAKEFFKEIFR